MKPKALVTGAAGFIGKHLVLELLRQQFQVRAFILPSERTGFFESLKDILTPSLAGLAARFESIDIVTGDIQVLPDVVKAVADCHWVFHLAAISHLWIPREEDYEKVNVEGTRHVCEASLNGGISKFVYTSTCEAIGKNPHNPMAFEDFVSKEEECPGPYARSKWKAEQIVANAVEKGLWAVTVNPGLPLGAGDALPTPVGKMIKFFLNKPGPFYYSTGFNCVDVSDLARGHIAAAQRGRPGQRYILGGPNLPMETFLQKIAHAGGKKMPSKKIPYALAMTVSRLMQAWSNWVSHRPPVSSVEGLKAVRHPFYFDCSKARYELGWSCESIDEALKAEIEYYL